MEGSIPRLGTEENRLKKISFSKNPAPEHRRDVFVRGMLRNRIPRVCFYFFPRNVIPSIFSSAERFGMEFWEFSDSQNGSEQKSKSFLLFLFQATEFRAFFSSAERFGIPRVFCSAEPRNSTGTDQLFRLFRLPRSNFLIGNCQPFVYVLADFVNFFEEPSPFELKKMRLTNF